MQDSKQQPPPWRLLVIELRGTTITIALSNRWSSPQLRTEESSILLMPFARNAMSAAMISQGPCLTKKRTRCSNSLPAFARTWKSGSGVFAELPSSVKEGWRAERRGSAEKDRGGVEKEIKG